MHRITSASAAAALLVIGLSACGSGSGSEESAEPTTVTTTVTPSSSTTQEEPEESEESTSTSSSATSSSASSPSTSPEESSTSTTSDEAGDEGGGEPTRISTVWVDDGWDIEEVSTDVCGPAGSYASPYSQQDEVFTCGPTAASALACIDSGGGDTTCITNALGRKAIHFDSPSIAGEQPGAREGESIPLYVELSDGTRCETISHDHDQHWQQKFSWYRCTDGSELLTDQEIGDTFDTDAEAWTVQRSVDKQAPETDHVAVAAYAGR